MDRNAYFWMIWIGGNILGAAAGAALGWVVLLAVLAATAETASPDLLGVLILFPSIGIGLGLGQWFALRRYLSGSLWWILATGLGWLLGLSVDFTFQQL